MLVVETVAKIRRDHDRGKPIKAIVRETGLTRNTVRKAVRAESAQFSYRRSASYRSEAKLASRHQLRANGKYEKKAAAKPRP
jgi:predicted transcriptional regulator